MGSACSPRSVRPFWRPKPHDARAWEAAEAEVEKRAVAKAMSSGVAVILQRLGEMRDHWTNVTINPPMSRK